MTWNLLIAIFLLVSVLLQFYLVTRFRKFGFIKKISKKSRFLGWACALILSALPWAFLFVNVYAAVIALVHLALIWAICDLFGFVFHKITQRKRKKYAAGAAALAITAVYLAVGWFCAHHVFRVDYTFTTEKPLPGGGLRIVELADSHIGITLDGEDFANQMDRINAEQPDAVVICGDFVDDDTKKEDMITACRALGKLKTSYGVYFIFGNHDNGYFDYRDFSSAELRENLVSNGVRILEDESVLIADSFYIVGRLDRTFPDRKEAPELTKSLDKSKYTVMLDHQPNDYANETLSGADLVLSGHTHGGHIFPAGPIGIWMGVNDRFYGTETRWLGSESKTDFLVTSGISGWGIPFKTGTISEYVVINVLNG